MEVNYKEDVAKPLPGWVCAAIEVGFVVFLASALIGVRILASA